MQLPQVEADELSQPIWNVTSSEVSRAYRKISVLVHPDKNPAANAQQAFEALNQAHRKLRDRGELVCFYRCPCMPFTLHASIIKLMLL